MGGVESRFGKNNAYSKLNHISFGLAMMSNAFISFCFTLHWVFLICYNGQPKLGKHGISSGSEMLRDPG